MDAAARAPGRPRPLRSPDPGTRGPLTVESGAARDHETAGPRAAREDLHEAARTRIRHPEAPDLTGPLTERAVEVELRDVEGPVAPHHPGGHRIAQLRRRAGDARGFGLGQHASEPHRAGGASEEPAGVGAEPEHGPRRLLPPHPDARELTADVGAIVRGPAEDRGSREQLGRAGARRRHRLGGADVERIDRAIRRRGPLAHPAEHAGVAEAVGRDRLVETHHVTDEQRGPQRVVAPPRRLGRPILRRHVVDPDGWHQQRQPAAPRAPGTPVPP